MKQTISVYDMREAFRQCDRYNHFSYDGYQVLFDALEELEESTGEEFELDVIALCCDFVEYDLEEVRSDYGQDDLDDDETLDYLHDNTWVCGQTDSTVIFQQF
jgi:hypothetical protein